MPSVFIFCILLGLLLLTLVTLDTLCLDHPPGLVIVLEVGHPNLQDAIKVNEMFKFATM